MPVFTRIQHLPCSRPLTITIGFFDGVHLGHQMILEKLVDYAKREKGSSTVITFSNHPLTVMDPSKTLHLLNTPKHKIKLIEQQGIDNIVMLPFTKKFSEQTAESFLAELSTVIGFDRLVLGSDAHLGKDREGNRATIESLATSMGFMIEYCPDLSAEGHRISSRSIRNAVEQGRLEETKKLTGRPYSIYGEASLLREGIYTLPIDNLCKPPKGDYSVNLICDGISYPAIASLGVGLEIHSLPSTLNFQGKSINLLFQ